MKFKILSFLLAQTVIARFLQSSNSTVDDFEPTVCLVELENQVYQLKYSTKNFFFSFTPNDTLEFNTCETLKDNNKTAPTFARRCGTSSCIALTNDVIDDMEVKKVDGNLVMTRSSTLTCAENPSRKSSFALELVCGPEKPAAFVDSYSDPCVMHI